MYFDGNGTLESAELEFTGLDRPGITQRFLDRFVRSYRDRLEGRTSFEVALAVERHLRELGADHLDS
jgi:hypothetical protein